MDDSEYYWKTDMNGVRFGGIEAAAYGFTDAKITVDTARECLYIPEANYEFVFAKMLDYSTGFYLTSDGTAVVDCGDI